MKKHLLITMVLVIMTLLQSCNLSTKETQDVIQNDKQYNICFILDGTDRLTEENSVPELSSDEISNMALTITEKGKGFLYVTYIDKN